ncbi:hypothetical protein QTP88_015680 [Uroleucon formosanum]
MENLGYLQRIVSFVVLILLEIGNHLIQSAFHIYQQYFQNYKKNLNDPLQQIARYERAINRETLAIEKQLNNTNEVLRGLPLIVDQNNINTSCSLMSSSSGGTSRTGQTPVTTKIKPSLTKNTASSPGFSTVGRNGKVLKNTNNPVSPNFQQINDNPPMLNTSHSTFNFNDATDSMPVLNSSLVDNQLNELTPVVSLSTDSSSSAQPSNTDIDI